ncbi:response regulator [Campylobacter concisus]|uniref:Response regulator n=1 Tax=Campylobacter concisus TaxID=199 RepID=A0AAE7TP84_9BACT|nr:response regulator [Campylobacter concisus]QPH86544.1 response regulator [Campylobacter concisus]
MKVQNNDIIDYLLQSGSSKTKDKKNSFDEILSLAMDKIASDAKISDKIEQFKKRLTEIGAVGFISELNSNKIEEKIAQKKKELTELLGIDDPAKTQDQKNELLKIMDKILSDYRKELNIALANQALLEKQKNLNSKNSSSVNLSSVLNELGLA